MSSPYFSIFDRPQENLYRDLISEMVNFYGLDCTYIARTSMSEFDDLFGDDPTKSFTEGYKIPVYILTAENFDGDIATFSKFGVILNKQLKLLMSHEQFQAATDQALGVRPREGDVIWMPNFKAFFEIKFCNQDHFFYAFGNAGKPFYGYELLLEEFRYNNEIVKSGDKIADKKILDLVATYAANIAPGTGDFIRGELVYQGTNAQAAFFTANVNAWNITTLDLDLQDLKGQYAVNTNLVGAKSGAVYELYDIELYDNVNTEQDDNLIIQSEASNYLDTSIIDPTGNPILTTIGE